MKNRFFTNGVPEPPLAESLASSQTRTIRDDLTRKKPFVGKLARIECGIDACNVVARYDDWRNACSAAFCFTAAGFSAPSKHSNREYLPRRVPDAGKIERIVHGGAPAKKGRERDYANRAFRG